MPIPNVTTGQLITESWGDAVADAINLIEGQVGSWTPELTFATPGTLSVTYSEQTGIYRRFGKTLFYVFRISTASFTRGTAAGNLLVTGLPFTVAVPIIPGLVSAQGWTKASYTAISCAPGNGGTSMTFPAMGSGQNLANLQATDLPSGGSVVLRGSGLYITT